MNTGQMLLVIFALVLLASVSLSINRMLIDKTTVMLAAEANQNAISIAQTMLDEIMTKSYDLATAPASGIRPRDGGNKIYDSTKFTAASGLGPSSAEVSSVSLPEPPDTVTPYKSISKYNDVDDYDDYTRKAYSSLLGTFTVIDTVYYVVESSPNVKSSSPTFYKKITVTVRHPNMPKPLQISDIAVYRRYF